MPSLANRADAQNEKAVEEINAYIAIRDLLLADAEEITTFANLDRVTLANEFVETCLRPARSPYEAQYLNEYEAVRERERCAAVKMRIAELRPGAAAVASAR